MQLENCLKLKPVWRATCASLLTFWENPLWQIWQENGLVSPWISLCLLRAALIAKILPQKSENMHNQQRIKQHAFIYHTRMHLRYWSCAPAAGALLVLVWQHSPCHTYHSWKIDCLLSDKSKLKFFNKNLKVYNQTWMSFDVPSKVCLCRECFMTKIAIEIRQDFVIIDGRRGFDFRWRAKFWEHGLFQLSRLGNVFLFKVFKRATQVKLKILLSTRRINFCTARGTHCCSVWFMTLILPFRYEAL